MRFALRALRSRNYRLFFLGQSISLIGLWMTRIAALWLVERLTGSPWMLGVVGFAQHAPTFCMAPLAGALADRWNRHHVLLATQAASMIVSLALAALALTGVIEVWHVLALSALQGLVRGFDIPARQAMVVDMVDDRDDLPNAIALNSTVFNSARLIGPAVGALAIATVGEGLCFLIDGLSYLAVIAALLAMRLPHLTRQPSPKHVLRDVADGFACTFGFAPHRALLMLAGVVVMLGMPHMALMPVFARQILDGNEVTYGVLVSASGAGALLGSIYLTTRRTVRGLGRILAGCAMVFGGAIAVFAMSRWIVLSVPLLVVSGFSMMVLMAGANTVLQTLVDDDKRGRVMSFFAMTFMGAMPVGSLIGGAVAEWVGAPLTVAVGGLLAIGMGIVFAFQLPALRAQARPIYVQRGIITEPVPPAGERPGLVEAARE